MAPLWLIESILKIDKVSGRQELNLTSPQQPIDEVRPLLWNKSASTRTIPPQHKFKLLSLLRTD